MLTQSSNANNGLGLNLTRRQALGHFLRERRAEIAPEEVGIASRRGRRTPGLRREEVAFLADIGVKWYARLEAGDDVRPSVATLTGIAFALRLSSAEIEYVLELAGLPQPLPATAEVDTGVAGPISSLMDSMRGVAATIGDRILTPLRWNALADALYGHSRANLPATRNASFEACSIRTTSPCSVPRERASSRGKWECSGSTFGPPGRVRSFCPFTR